MSTLIMNKPHTDARFWDRIYIYATGVTPSPDGKHVVYQQDWHTDLYVCTTGFSQYLPYVHRP